MDINMAVTRTFSAGTIYNGTKTTRSDDVSTARRHSCTGIRALLWAANSAKSFGSSLGTDSQSGRDTTFPNILTPDSIPQFTIPSLSVQTSLKSSDIIGNKQRREDNAEKEHLGSPGINSTTALSCPRLSSSSSPPASSAFNSSLRVLDRRAQRSISDPLTQRPRLYRDHTVPCPYVEAQHCWDPDTRAALSLPHMAKVTTPYGFVTLTQSPQMASEETLLCQAERLRRSNKNEESLRFYNKTPVTRKAAINIADKFSHQPTARLGLSKDDAESKTGIRASKDDTKMLKGTVASSSFSSASSSTKAVTDGKLKQRLCGIIRKHFMRSGCRSPAL